MAETWSQHDPSNWIFLNPNFCRKVCSMPNFTLLDVSSKPLSKNCQTTVLYSPIRVLIWSFNLSLLESQSTCPEIIHVKFQISGCILQFPFLKMAKILLSYGLNMVLTLSFKLVFLNLKQYSKGYFMPNFTLLCVSYGPFLINGQNMALSCPKHGYHMILQLGLS